MSSIKSEEIFQYLQDLGCCRKCCYRYLCNKSVAYFTVIDEKDQICENILESETKKFKLNPCLVCLGLLECTGLHDILCRDEFKKVNEYDSSVFTCSISMPACILIREHSMRLHLEEKFPSFYSEDNKEVPINWAWKMFVKDSMSQKIDKNFQNSDVCDFSINVCVQYEAEDKELEILTKIQPEIFETRKKQHRKFNGELFSRKGVLSALSQTQNCMFKYHCDVPPSLPSASVTCKSIECKHNPIYIAGRYCKYSRELSQTPWVVDGIKLMESSVQDIIFRGFAEFLNTKETNIKFSSSGREDCDVRCLGKGRPFSIEVANPKKTNFSFDEFRTLEQLINRSSNLIKVTDLQKVDRLDLNNLKDGENVKTKEYIALCQLKYPVSVEMIEKINNIGELTLSQRTPIRVLHRRALSDRTRKIYKMSSKRVTERPNLFELNVTTQAGTYVKEFVHGDFGRTKPNIREILATDVDIIALDVVAINLDWPKPVNYS